MCGNRVGQGVQLAAGEVVSVHWEEGREGVAVGRCGGVLGVEGVEAAGDDGGEGGFSWGGGRLGGRERGREGWREGGRERRRYLSRGCRRRRLGGVGRGGDGCSFLGDGG